MIDAVYLDFDGVLHPQDCAYFIEEGQTLRVEGEGIFRWLPILEEILEPHPEIKIVVHSSWRNHYYDDELKHMLGKNLGSRLLGSTDNRGANRYENILLDCFDRGIHNMIILDDDHREFPPLCQEWIRCNSKYGISEESVQQSIRNFISPPTVSMLHTVLP